MSASDRTAAWHDADRSGGWMLGRTRRVHFIGIGGIGMSGIAELLVNAGYDVSGSDVKESDVTARLARLGAHVYRGHAASHVERADVVVMSSAVDGENPEVVEARRRRIPVIPRAEMLAELMRLRYGIAIAGAHGKTTTTSMVALVLERAGLDPTAVIGGRLSAFGSNARLGRGQWMVVEADESDRSFLKLAPAIALITNIDREHMDAYGSWDRLQDAFAEFVNKVPFYGAAVLCADDPAVRRLAERVVRRVVTYGFADEAGQPAVSAADVRLEPFASRCVVSHVVNGASTVLGELTLQVPGRHNLLNALGAVAIGLELQIPFAPIAEALGEFAGAERRFQVRGERRGVMVVDDYGHHPTEINAVVAAARSTGRRLVLVFQPHRYTRTRDLLPEFAAALAAADQVVLTDIYPAGERPIPGVTSQRLADAVAAAPCPVQLVADVADLPQQVAAAARAGDLVITLGAGSIAGVADRIVAALGGADEFEPQGPATPCP